MVTQYLKVLMPSLRSVLSSAKGEGLLEMSQGSTIIYEGFSFRVPLGGHQALLSPVPVFSHSSLTHRSPMGHLALGGPEVHAGLCGSGGDGCRGLSGPEVHSDSLCFQ